MRHRGRPTRTARRHGGLTRMPAGSHRFSFPAKAELERAADPGLVAPAASAFSPAASYPRSAPALPAPAPHATADSRQAPQGRFGLRASRPGRGRDYSPFLLIPGIAVPPTWPASGTFGPASPSLAGPPAARASSPAAAGPAGEGGQVLLRQGPCLRRVIRPARPFLRERRQGLSA